MVTLALIGLVGGVITGISPCILPVLPVIFLSGGAQAARNADRDGNGDADRDGNGDADRDGNGNGNGNADRRREGRAGRRPYLVVAGLTLSFSVFTLVGTLVLSALPVPQGIVRWTGLVLLVLLGAGMMFPRVEALLERPFARLPQRRVGADRGGFVLGLVLGTVYVPCAGPVLAAITVAGATGRISGHVVVLTVAFAIGTAAPLLAFALAGRGIAERLRVFRDHQRRIRVVAGVVVVALAVALAGHLTDAVQRAVPDYTAALNKDMNSSGGAARALAPAGSSGALAACVRALDPSAGLENCGTAPAITGIQQWLNTPGGSPLNLTSLRGRVVLVDFWAYSCINCQRAITHVTSWYSTYRAAGFEVIGVHTPEYAFEHVPADVAAGARRLGISYPVALDNVYATWNAYGNDSWPAEYLIDATGTVRHVSIGEGDYAHTESLIRQLLTAAHPGTALPGATHVADTTPTYPYQTPETYLGSQRANNFAYGPTLRAGTRTYHYPRTVPGDAFALSGTWAVGGQAVTARSKGAGIAMNFDANDVYLDVGGTGTLTATVNGTTTTYAISGAPDIHTLVSRDAPTRATLKVTLSPGLTAYSFTFG